MKINTNYNNIYNDYDNYYGREDQSIYKSNKTIKGTEYNDFFNVLGDDLKIKSGDGNDYIRVEGFDNVVDAGNGDDIIDLVVIPGKALHYNRHVDDLFHPIKQLGGFNPVEYDVTGGAGCDIFKITPSDKVYADFAHASFAEINIKDFNKSEDKIDLTAFGIDYDDIKSISHKDELYLTKVYDVENTPNQVIALFRIDLQDMEWSDLDESNFVTVNEFDLA